MAITALVTDSTAYLCADQAAELGVTVVPLHVTLGDWTFAEGSVEPREFYARLRASRERPTTSQPSPGDFLAAFEAAGAGGATGVVAVVCGSGLSGTYGSATLAARSAGLPVHVVDSGTISGGLQLVVLQVARALADGAAAAEAVALAEAMAGRVWSTWSSDTHQLLRGGGRLTAELPDGDGVDVLTLEGARGVRTLGKVRTLADSVRVQAEVIKVAAARGPTLVTVGHGDVPAAADALADALRGAPGVLGVQRYVVGPVVGAHAGPGSYGANYLSAQPT